MKKVSLAFCLFAFAFSGAADAAGTYYTGSYQSPQRRYGQPAAQQNYSAAAYQPQPASRFNQGGSGPYSMNPAYQRNQSGVQQQTKQQGAGKGEFYLSGGISRQVANWQLSMKKAGSILHYDDISWNVLDVNAGYNFGIIKLDGGLSYGMQFGDSHMIDDDITNGGEWINDVEAEPNGPGTGYEVIGSIYNKVISAGTSSGGSMLGFNLGLGLADKLALGKAKLTPSIGYRYFSHSLKTENNSGLAMETGYCVTTPGTDETQCNPLIMIDVDKDGDIDDQDFIFWDTNPVPGGDIYFGDTFSFKQAGVSHKYDTSWSGPYVALDMDYEITSGNAVSARIELGLPAYTSAGDQPYRTDWMHPKSVEDSSGFGGAYHLGLGADWKTALTDSVMLSIGFVYDYYTVSGADAKTFLNSNYYNTFYWNYINQYYSGDQSAAIAAGDATVMGIQNLINECPDFVCTAKNEIDSFYKSMGIRLGLFAKF
jgi:hypothetical protein